jgi:hypothetical protein
LKTCPLANDKNEKNRYIDKDFKLKKKSKDSTKDKDPSENDY